ncbi:hypothetical protein KI809_05525 [Geobacter pelophilus]|uniref:Uncharacterized protein n=1 Tax=Geoanaerobacter pelophilus TaxID=60036 RepID=A0AAW4L7I2_9BACT|nr:hypothetical protein [Geoanaerobacter pelophilus]MBT0663757.1 hypothetical protein [Geoanaerobacter pelophilus]
MKDTGEKPWGEVAANGLIIAMVIVGTMLFVNIPDATRGEGLMSKLFIGFLGAIITVQIIPALVMIAAMVKGVAGSAKRLGKHSAVPEAGPEK